MSISSCTALADEQGKELARHGTPAFPAACYRDDLNELSVPWHWHEELELVTVAEGTLSASAGGTILTIKQGDGIFLNKETLHQMQKGRTPPAGSTPSSSTAAWWAAAWTASSGRNTWSLCSLTPAFPSAS